MDFSALALPTIEVLPVDGEGTARPTLRWRVEGASSAELTVGALISVGPSWTFVAPPEARSARVPALPADLAAYAPTHVVIPLFVGVIDHSHLASYDDARARLRDTLLMAKGERALQRDGTILSSVWTSYY